MSEGILIGLSSLAGAVAVALFGWDTHAPQFTRHATDWRRAEFA